MIYIRKEEGPNRNQDVSESQHEGQRSAAHSQQPSQDAQNKYKRVKAKPSSS